MATKLTKKQQMFVAAYMVDFNATQAAIAAGYSDKCADVMGCKLVANGKIADLIAAKTGKRLGKYEVTADRTVQEIAKIAFMDPRKFFESDGSLKRITDLDDDTAASLAGMEVTELFEGDGDQKHAYGLLKKVKIASKLEALEKLGKHLKLFGEASQVNVNLGVQLIHNIPQPERE